MEVLSLLAALIPLAVMIFKEYFSRAAAARAKNEAYVLDEKERHSIFEAATDKLRAQAAERSAGAGNAWDGQDKPESKP